MPVRIPSLFPIAGLGATLVALLGAASAQAFGVLPAGADGARWAEPTVLVELHEAGVDDLSDGSDLDAVRSAMNSWNAVSCSTIELRETGTTAATENLVVSGATDGINRILWVEDSSFPGGPGTLALTLVSYDTASGIIAEADIAFNGYNTTRPWTTSGEGNGIDVESIAVHELGHLIGLRHIFSGANLIDPPSMSANLDASTAHRTLHADDMAGACFLYPATDYACTADCDCPTLKPTDVNGLEYGGGQMVCVGGTCGMSTTTEVPLGSECGAGRTCAAGLFCQPTEAASFCSQSCTPNTADACPGGLTCFDFGGPGACLPGDWENTPICLADVGASNGASGEAEGECEGDACSGEDADDGPGGCSMSGDASHPWLWSLLALALLFRPRRRRTR
jgi:hypothetical protein